MIDLVFVGSIYLHDSRKQSLLVHAPVIIDDLNSAMPAVIADKKMEAVFLDQGVSSMPRD